MSAPSWRDLGHVQPRSAAETEPALRPSNGPRPSNDQWSVFIVPFSHNDIGWAGTPAEVATHRVQIIDSALGLVADEQSGFRFSMEAALYLAEYLDRKPENATLVRDELRRGRLEWGASYVQAYEGLQTDEGLLRQFVIGKRLLEEAVGYQARGYWNVDVVARTLQLPQVLRHAGVDYMVVSRNRPGLYWWQGPDGSRVLTFNFWEGSYGRGGVFDSEKHHHSPLEMAVADGDASDEFFGLDTVRRGLDVLADQWSEALDEAGLPHALAVVLAADYSVPNPAVIDLIRRAHSTPSDDSGRELQLRLGTVREYVDWITERSTLEHLPVERGEVPNPWVYQQPGHWEVVSKLRLGQEAIAAAEALWTLACLRAQDWSGYPARELRVAWEDSLYPDHGYGGLHGEGTDSVFQDRVNRGFFGAQRLLLAGLEQLELTGAPSGGGVHVVVFNASSRPVSDWIDVPGLVVDNGDGVAVTDGEGCPVQHQLTASPEAGLGPRVGLLVEEVPPFGFHDMHIRRVTRGQAASPEDPVRMAGEDVIWDTSDVLARISAAGLAELRVDGVSLLSTDHYLGGEVIQLASPGVDVGRHEADAGYDWRIVRPFQPQADGQVRPIGAHVELIERGPIRWTVEAVSDHRQCRVTQRFMFYPRLDRIDLSASLTGWTGEHGREFRWIFPLKAPAARVRYGVPFGHAIVGEHEVEEFRDARPREVLRWLMAGDGAATLALSTPVTTFDWCDPTGLDMTGTYLQLVLLASKRSIHPRGNWYGQEGSHSYTASLHLRAQSPAAMERAARQRGALWVTTGTASEPAARGDAASRSYAGVIAALEPDHVFVTAVKKHELESAVVLRLFEASGQPAAVRLRTGFPVANVREVNGLEVASATTSDVRQEDPKQIVLSLRPWQIATLALTPEVGR
jgi:alpha-mannosidase